MVEIRRPRKQVAKPGLFTFRNVILALVALQGLRMFFTLLQTTTAPTDKQDAGHLRPMGMKDRLQDSHHIRKPDKPKPELDANTHEKHHEKLEDPHELDIHPDEPDEEPEEPDLPVEHHESHPQEPDLPDEHQEPDLPDEHHDPDAQDSNHGHEVKNTLGEPIPGSPKNNLVVDKKGTGPTKLGYVNDFQDERGNPPFRTVIVEASDTSQSVASLVGETSVKPCDISQGRKLEINPKCLDPDTPLIAYNSASFPRTWCGQEIKSGEAVVMGEHCTDPIVHLFSTETPPVSGEEMAPMIIKSHGDVEIHDSDLETVQCDIPCQQEKGMDGPMRFIHGEPWTITQAWADAKIEQTNFRVDKYYSTQSFQSSVPLTYFNFEKLSLRNRPAVDYDTSKNKAVYLVNTICSAPSTKRHKYFHALAVVYPIDAYGTCHHNTDVPAGMTMETQEGRIEIMKQYRFVLAFDPSSEKDHITSLVWEAFVSGALPVVVGAENIKDHMPPHSFINAGDYKNWDELAAYVKQVAADKTLWDSYHTWRTDEKALAALEAKYEFSRTDPTCRMCRWAYAKKYGLGWDEGKQEVTEVKSPRELCTSSSKGLVSKPFQEEWVARFDNDEDALKQDEGASEMCTSMTSEGTIESDSFKVHRTIVRHDGVTDILISSVESDNNDGEVVLRLILPGVRNSDGACFHNTHTLVKTMTRGPMVSSASIQDEFSKVTVLSDWVTSVTSPSEGVMEVVIQKAKEGQIGKDIPKRIRVLTENVDNINFKMTEFFPSSFGKQMTKDFTDPLEVFYADS